ncbi:MAG: tyrosine-protein kinase family protein [Bradymonadales bacterium]|nr:tyrosine-protein kinase family protein [Bradymonadales bacterium]
MQYRAQREPISPGVERSRHRPSRGPEALTYDLANVIALIGNFGSGKSEVAVNLALTLAAEGRKVAIADLDVVNPYFRCREAMDLLASHDIELVMPDTRYFSADLPIVVPRIKAIIERPDDCSILDVGGDDVGATVLASLADAFRSVRHDFLQVINLSRPFTDTVEGCLAIGRQIERAARLTITGLVGNTHLMDETTPEHLAEGYAFVQEVSRTTGLPVKFVTVDRSLMASVPVDDWSCPVLPLTRHLLPPWKRPEADLGSDNFLLRGRGISPHLHKE